MTEAEVHELITATVLFLAVMWGFRQVIKLIKDDR